MSWVYVGILETSLITLVERISQRDLASQASKDRDVKKKKSGGKGEAFNGRVLIPLGLGCFTNFKKWGIRLGTSVLLLGSSS